MAAMEIQPLFTDQARQCSLGAVLRWSDTAQAALYGSVPDAEVRAALLRAWERSLVTRSNQVELLLPGRAWEEALSATLGATVRVAPRVTKVGRTSMGVGFEISTSRGVPLARVASVMVAVDEETASKPVPVPHPEALRALSKDFPAVKVPSISTRPSDAFVWRAEVRSSDCDLFGHVNNAVYGDYMEDARRAAAARPGALPPVAAEAAAADARIASVDYLGQAKARDAIEVAVWWDAAARALGVELTAGGGGVHPRRRRALDHPDVEFVSCAAGGGVHSCASVALLVCLFDRLGAGLSEA
eukprot:CAMPEP_0175693732 /NCGR_PEP_ID=MMETSP0097-20121207/31576_1 /TAXON_ID=311494 /ORGANISM="Alexandrium monilatum, Strain CCMP3105" /LENGTH=300 /DNA_ID=CAMNT_0017000845 /DNA_START=15 /DNA_END=912 /DNA_ORIENTATION=+